MKINEYRLQTGRTLVDLESMEKNLTHMSFGVITEVGELVDIYKKEIAYGKAKDIVNVKEEIGDIMWYISNTLNFLEMSDEQFDFQQRMLEVAKQLAEEIISRPDFTPLLLLANADNFSKSCFKLNEKQIGAQCLIMIDDLKYMCENLGINFEECLDLNIQKLKVRFPEKFTQEQALERDLTKEREVLDGKKDS